MKRRNIILATAMILLNSVLIQAAPYVYINGERAILEKAPLVVSGRTYLPLRATGEALGTIVDWKSETKTITISRSYKKVVLRIGETTARANNEIVTLDAPAFVKDSVTYVPVRFVADCLGIQVDYYSGSQIVSLITDSIKAASIQAQLSEIKEVIVQASDLKKESIANYGNAFVGKANSNAYTDKPIEQVALITKADLPIQIDDMILYDISYNSDNSVSAKWKMLNGNSQGWRLALSDVNGLVRIRDSVENIVGSDGILKGYYPNVGLSDLVVFGDRNFEKYTLDKVKYFAIIKKNNMVAISSTEVKK